MFRSIITVITVALLLSGRPALGQGASGNGEEVWALLASQSQATGSFVQKLIDDDGELLEQTRGRYAVLRPGFFRWEIQAPDEQLIVVSGSDLWHYDRDLGAATRRDTSQTSEFTPLELLAGDSDELRAKFNSKALGPSRVRLMPTFPQAGFASVEITWEEKQVVAMVVVDRSGQTIDLALTPDRDPTPLTAGDFEFTPPPGVDVYEPSDY